MEELKLKAVFQQRPEGSERRKPDGKVSQADDSKVQRPLGGKIMGMFKAQRQVQGGWNGVSKGEWWELKSLRS